MSSQEDHTFETADAGAALTFPMQAGALRKGGHVMLNGNPCKIVEISTSKTGKHGHAKCNIVGIDIFTGKKCQDLCPSSHNMEVPNVAKEEFTLLDLDDDSGAVSVLRENGETKDDLNLPKDTTNNYEDHAVELIKAFNDGKSVTVTVQAAMGQEKIISFKEIAA